MTFSKLISELGGPTAVSVAIGAGSAQAVWNMADRESIPAQYWPRVVAAAEARGLQGITIERLADMQAECAEARRRERAAKREGAAA